MLRLPEPGVHLFVLAPIYAVLGAIVLAGLARGILLILYNRRVSKIHGGFHAPSLPSGPLLPLRGMHGPYLFRFLFASSNPNQII
jgi:hypothetical protein